jgi:ATP-dependent Lhr-like helicase
MREPESNPRTAVVAATDPANPYGTALPWPEPDLTRVVGATVVIVDGALVVYLARGYRELTVVLPQDEPFRSRVARAAAQALMTHARGDKARPRPMFIAAIGGHPSLDHPFAAFLEEAGFARAGAGLHVPRTAFDGEADRALDPALHDDADVDA